MSLMKKAKQSYNAKMQEYQKAKEAAIKAEGEQQQVGQSQQAIKMSSSASSSTLGAVLSGTGKVDKKRKQEEDLFNKVCERSEVQIYCTLTSIGYLNLNLYFELTNYLTQLNILKKTFVRTMPFLKNQSLILEQVVNCKQHCISYVNTIL